MQRSKPSALILDRDGTINAMVTNPSGKQDSPYYPSQLELYPRLCQMLKPWAANQIPIFIVTNQPGIAKGHFKQTDLDEVHSLLRQKLESEGIRLTDIFYCTHHPVGKPGGLQSLIGPCKCRKPNPGMLFSIQNKYNISLAQAIYIGDSLVDREAAAAADIQNFFLVRTFISSSVPNEKKVIPYPDAPTFEEILSKAARLFIP